MRNIFVFICFIFLILGFPTLSASARDCPNLSLMLDPGLSEKIVAANWGTGNSLEFKNANLVELGCNQYQIYSIQLTAPMARIDQILRLGKSQAYMVTTDLSQPAGSYNGPLTEFYSITDNHIQRIDVAFPDGSRKPVQLSKTEKSEWKEETRGGKIDFYYVSCFPKNGKFFIYFSHFKASDGVWSGSIRIEPGFWEIEEGFPEISQFP